MNDLTPEEVQAMKGTEFIYEYNDETNVKAFIAQAELGKGLTCKALDQLWSDGREIWDADSIVNDPKGYDNVICYPEERPNLNEHIQRALKEIKSTGKYRTIESHESFGVMATCSFS